MLKRKGHMSRSIGMISQTSLSFRNGVYCTRISVSSMRFVI